MISKSYLEGRKVFGNDPWLIEIADSDMSFIEMLHSPEMYIPHHVLEWKYSSKELQNMERYDKVSPDELIWVKEETHRHNKVIHKGELEAPIKSSESHKGLDNHWTGRKHSEATKNKISESKKGKAPGNKGNPNTLFGKMFIEHFGILPTDDLKLYNRELMWYKRHKTCRWE
jgi:hypothetical protein